MADEIEKLTDRVLHFRDARNWKQFHKPKDLAISLSLEAGEVLEHFQWKSETEIEEYVKTNKDEIADELVDVLSYVLIMAHDLDINLVDAQEKKIKKNEKKYPVEKAAGNSAKYDKL